MKGNDHEIVKSPFIWSRNVLPLVNGLSALCLCGQLFNLLEVCAVTPATVPGLERKRPPWTFAVYANSAQTLDFMKGNVHGALLDNLDSANSVEELTPTVESLPKPYAVMCAFLVVCPNQDNSSRCRETGCWLNVWLMQSCSWRVTSKVLPVRRFRLMGLFDSNVRCRRVSPDIRTCPCAQGSGLPGR